MPGKPGHLEVSFRVNLLLVLAEPFDYVVYQVHLGRVKANLRSYSVLCAWHKFRIGVGDIVLPFEHELLAAIWSEVNLHPEFGVLFVAY